MGKILIVDDDRDLRLLFSSALLQEGYEVLEAINGEEALEIVRVEKPDVMLLDLMMPVMDGHKTAIKVKTDKTYDYIYIIVVTAKIGKNNQVESLKYTDDFIEKPVDIDILKARVDVGVRLVNSLKEKEQLLTDLSISLSQAVESRDTVTAEHVKRVSELSIRIAQHLGYDDKFVENVKYAAIFHDIGKIGIDDSILKKSSNLTEDEYKIIKSHPIIGYNILKPINYFKNILPGILYHHERMDGKGYPEGLKGNEIPVIARIIAVADAFDAITSERSYKKALSPREAISEIGKEKYDPDIVKALVEILESEK